MDGEKSNGGFLVGGSAKFNLATLVVVVGLVVGGVNYITKDKTDGAERDAILKQQAEELAGIRKELAEIREINKKTYGWTQVIDDRIYTIREELREMRKARR